jgi:hypothetical protein
MNRSIITYLEGSSVFSMPAGKRMKVGVSTGSIRPIRRKPKTSTNFLKGRRMFGLSSAKNIGSRLKPKR